MDKVLQCIISFNNYIEGDFQMREFKYESFNKLLNDFENIGDINITNDEIEGNLRPKGSLITEVIIKDDHHAEYLVKTYNDNLFKIFYYKK